jgi:hypothetical protein
LLNVHSRGAYFNPGVKVMVLPVLGIIMPTLASIIYHYMSCLASSYGLNAIHSCGRCSWGLRATAYLITQPRSYSQNAHGLHKSNLNGM